MKALFTKSSKPKSPVEVVCKTRTLLDSVQFNACEFRGARGEDKMNELNKLIRDLKSILYGTSETEPVAESCRQVTEEFFKGETLRFLILCLPKLQLEARKDATQVVANLQRQTVHGKLFAALYLEHNLDLLDILQSGYEDSEIALHYGAMLRDCIRHQAMAKYLLESENFKKFFEYIQLPSFDVAADATVTFKELLTRHKSTVATFLIKNYDWFFAEFNKKLLESSNYITRRQGIKLLGEILLDRSNSCVMIKYISSKENLKILMNLLRETSKCIKVDAFHVFKLFAANKNKPVEIVNILIANRTKLLRYLAEFKLEKEDEQFEDDKAEVVRAIAQLELKVH